MKHLPDGMYIVHGRCIFENMQIYKYEIYKYEIYKYTNMKYTDTQI
jgi:hypothetical protein